MDANGFFTSTNHGKNRVQISKQTNEILRSIALISFFSKKYNQRQTRKPEDTTREAFI
jgi:hypothetical protein